MDVKSTKVPIQDVGSHRWRQKLRTKLSASLDQKVVGPDRGGPWLRSNGDCGKGQSSGSSDIIEESDELVANGEGDSAAQDLQEQQEQGEVSLVCRPKGFKQQVDEGHVVTLSEGTVLTLPSVNCHQPQALCYLQGPEVKTTSGT